MTKIALLGSLESIYGLLWLTYNDIGLRQKLISCYIICIIFLFLHSFIPVVWVGGRPKGLPKMTEYQSNPPCRFKASRGFSPQRVFCRFSGGDGGGGNGESGLSISGWDRTRKVRNEIDFHCSVWELQIPYSMQGGTRLENPWIYIYPLSSNIVKVIE